MRTVGSSPGYSTTNLLLLFPFILSPLFLNPPQPVLASSPSCSALLRFFHSDRMPFWSLGLDALLRAFGKSSYGQPQNETTAHVWTCNCFKCYGGGVSHQHNNNNNTITVIITYIIIIVIMMIIIIVVIMIIIW